MIIQNQEKGTGEKLEGEMVRYLYLYGGRDMGRHFHGAYRSDSLCWNKDTGLMEDMVNVIEESEDGCLWFGSYVAPRGGISIWNGKAFLYDDLAHPNIAAMLRLLPEECLPEAV